MTNKDEERRTKNEERRAAVGGRFGGLRARFGGGRATAVEVPVGHPPLALRAVERTLALFVAGLTDGALVVAESVEATGRGAYTDGRTIYLPERVAHTPTRAGNLGLYKTLIAHASAQLRYGTLAQDG